MRVIGGEKRGIPLLDFRQETVRPTLDRVKESMFNIIQFFPSGQILDLFAGTGQLGIEALSRGSQQAVFCDKDAASVALIRKNLKKTGLEDRAIILQVDYKRYLKYDGAGRFDLIFLDPPYQTGLAEKALCLLGEGRLLAEECTVVVECERQERFPEVAGVLCLGRRYDYGNVSVLIYRRKEAVG